MARDEFLQRLVRRLALLPGPAGFTRKIYLRLLGANIGTGTRIPRCHIPWPHQVAIGKECVLEPDIHFRFDWYWKPGPNILIGDRVFIGRGVEFNIQGRLEIGDHSLIASRCVFVDHDHGMDRARPMRKQPPYIRPIQIGDNVWIGTSAVILKGSQIGNGAVVGAGSVVTKSIPADEIWCGNPARKIGERH